MSKTAKKVLIVDDDENITRTFSRILQKHGYETDVAQTGKEAIALTQAKRYDLALVDVCLPDINGNELLSQLDDDGSKMVTVIVTGFPTAPPKVGKKADAYLLKPVKPQDLLAVIARKLCQT